MTVKIIPEADKSEMAQLYAAKLCDTDDLAKAYGVSKRTINRVMVEQGVNHIRVHKPKAKGPDLPITMEPDAQDIVIDETPAPTLSKPKESLLARFWAHVKFCLTYPFK